MAYTDNRLDPKLDIVGTIEHQQNLDVSDEALFYGVVVRSGISAVVSGNNITGLLNITADSDCNYIQLGGVNSGLYKINTVISNTAITVEETLINDSSVSWSERLPYSLQDDINYIRSDRANIKGVGYNLPVPTYIRPSNTTDILDVNLSNISGKTTDVKTIILNRMFLNQTPTIGQSYILLTDTGNLKHADTIDLTGIPTTQNGDSLYKCYVELLDPSSNPILTQDGYKVFGITNSLGALSPDSINIDFFYIPLGGDISNGLPYSWESTQQASINIYYPYRERLDLIDENAFRNILVNGLVSSTGNGNHENLDTLVHDIVEDGYNEVSYINNNISSIIFWTNNLKTKKVREYNLEYSNNKVSQVISIQYDLNGLEISRLTEDVIYKNGLIDYILSNKEGDGENGGVGGSADGYGITEDSHAALRQLIHFIDDGPAEGFVTGAYKEIIGGAFPTQEIWWESPLKTRRILTINITRNNKQQPIIIEWIMFSNGIPTSNVVDTVQYDGIFEINRTRVIG